MQPLTMAKALVSSGVPLRAIAACCSPVLTYHACFDHLPPNIHELDNVTRYWLYEHIKSLRRHYTFVSIDEFCEARVRRGLAAVTFDDGYKSTITAALPVCAAAGVPLTVFVTTVELEGGTFWRHKVVAVEQRGLVAKCEQGLVETRKVPGLSWHEYTKHPSNNSRIVEREVDAFLTQERVKIEKTKYLFDLKEQLVVHPLLWYGNHTSRHYVLSSLPRDEQYAEIKKSQDMLEAMRLPRVSRVFSVPFGKEHHINRDSLGVIHELGYRAVVLNRGRLNRIGFARKQFGIELIDRFSAGNDPVEWPLRSAFLRTMLSQ